MGQKMTTSSYIPPKGEEITRNRFDFINIIGRGGFGKVWKVIDKKSKLEYALKEMQKVKVIDKKSENSIKYERELLSRLKHPFIVNMYYAFQDYNNLYLVMDLLHGGDLRYHVSRQKRFSEEQTKFFIACIVTALEYIHSKSVIHRDIKPENLVFDEKGYVRITDFGIAKVFSKANANETSGTPGYMSPEVMRAQTHTYTVDYFAVGVIGHEFMLGKRPYVGKSRKEIKEQMMAKQAFIKNEDIPQGWSIESADFIDKLLQRKPELRLGYNGSFEIKDHPWFIQFPWNELYNKRLCSPFIPERKDNYDKRYCEAIEKLGLDTKVRYEQYKSNPRFESAFVNFTFYNVDTEEVISRQYQSSQNKQFPYEKPQYDYTKKRCQSAIGFSTRDNSKEIEVDKKILYKGSEMNKANSKSNILESNQVVNSPLNSNGIKLSSSYCNNNYTIQKAKTIAVHHQYPPAPNKIPIPIDKRSFIKSISNIGVSPYSTKNSKRTTEDSSISALSMLRTGANLYKNTMKTGETSKNLRTGSLVNTPNTSTSTTINKPPLGLQRSSSSYGLYAMKNNNIGYNTNVSFNQFNQLNQLNQLNQANLHATINNKSIEVGQKMMSNINTNEKKARLISNLNASSSSSALLKNYRSNNYSLNSTGGSSRSKIMR